MPAANITFRIGNGGSVPNPSGTTTCIIRMSSQTWGNCGGCTYSGFTVINGVSSGSFNMSPASNNNDTQSLSVAWQG